MRATRRHPMAGGALFAPGVDRERTVLDVERGKRRRTVWWLYEC
jgi:hypothetical protein